MVLCYYQFQHANQTFNNAFSSIAQNFPTFLWRWEKERKEKERRAREKEQREKEEAARRQQEEEDEMDDFVVPDIESGKGHSLSFGLLDCLHIMS